jgi:hypothetical protein
LLPSSPLAPRCRRPKRLGSDRRSAGTAVQNKHRTFAQLWQDICRAACQLNKFYKFSGPGSSHASDGAPSCEAITDRPCVGQLREPCLGVLRQPEQG